MMTSGPQGSIRMSDRAGMLNSPRVTHGYSARPQLASGGNQPDGVYDARRQGCPVQAGPPSSRTD